MQINRSNAIPLVFPPTSPPSGGAAPAAAPVPTPVKITPVAPQDSGVVYTASAPAAQVAADSDFDSLSLQNQLTLGHDSGVFTKITMSKDGVLVFKPTAPPKAADFATAAAATMKDFEEGIALMKKNTGEHHDKPPHSLSGKLKELTARLNVFA